MMIEDDLKLRSLMIVIDTVRFSVHQLFSSCNPKQACVHRSLWNVPSIIFHEIFFHKHQ